MPRATTLLSIASIATMIVVGGPIAARAAGPKTITMPNLTPDMPDGPSKAVYTDRCTQCHTPRYVLNQPAFSRDAWTAEVQKMRKNYGAPIADEQVEPIVDYLMSVRGAPAKP